MSEENVVAPEIIDEARKGGWVPEEDFHDDPVKWVDAETFVKRGREINPILRKHNKDLQKQLDQALHNINEIKETTKEFKELQKKAFEKEKKDLTNQIAALREAKKVAYTEQDGDRVVEIEEAIDELKEEQKNLTPPKELPEYTAPEVKVDATLQAWLDKNEWFGQDVKLTERVNGLGFALRNKNPGLQGKAFLDALDEEIEDVFGDKLKRKKPISAVESGNSSARPSRSGKKTFEDLPHEAQIVCDRQIKQKLWKDRAEYVAMYDFE